MAQATFTPRMVARVVAKRIGREYDAKRVRAWVRENVDEYDDDGYTAHLYSAALAKRIEDALVTRAKGGRPQAASKGRQGTPKPASKSPATSTSTRSNGAVDAAIVKASE